MERQSHLKDPNPTRQASGHPSPACPRPARRAPRAGGIAPRKIACRAGAARSVLTRPRVSRATAARCRHARRASNTPCTVRTPRHCSASASRRPGAARTSCARTGALLQSAPPPRASAGKTPCTVRTHLRGASPAARRPRSGSAPGPRPCRRRTPRIGRIRAMAARTMHRQAHRARAPRCARPYCSLPPGWTVPHAPKQERLNADAQRMHAKHADGPEAGMDLHGDHRPAGPDEPCRRGDPCPIRVLSVHPPASA
jgi:hypothetical protein